MIETSGLSKVYGGHKAIDQVGFKINEGEIVGLLGLNGAGKSTILKILGCFLMPSSGMASVAGFRVDEQPDEIRRRIGYLPDSPPLYDEMTITAYLKYVAKLKNVPSGEIDAAVEKAMVRTNLQDRADFRLGELSHGYRQRAGIAQAIVHSPPVLILDEPINGLDPVQIVEMRDLILSLKGDHTVILSSHILSEITRTCDRILIVDQGRLVAEGAQDELERRVEGGMRLAVEFRGELTKVRAAVEAIDGVRLLEAKAGEPGCELLRLETQGDVRAELATAVIGTGAGLLSLQQDEAGLEGIFMRLVNSSSREVHSHG